MTLHVSAPGKLMVFGEHAVVYGYPCIVTAVDRRLSVSISPHNDRDQFITPGVSNTQFIEKTLEMYRKRFNKSNFLKITTQSQFSHKFGFGSSSAVTIALIKALSEYYNDGQDDKSIFNLAYHIVLAVQGTGSGFDLAAAAYGGTLEFVKGGDVIEPLSISSLPLIVAYSGIKADTPTIVKALGERYKIDRSRIDSIFKRIAEIVNTGKHSILLSDYKSAGELMSENHDLLRQLGVSTQKLDSLVNAAISGGAYGAKLSGAGGGDCIICLAPDDKREEVKRSLVNAGGEIIEVACNTEGVRVEPYEINSSSTI